ncbi:MAG: hypothetical protein ACXAC5_04200 [Promethearchaeota archaeon]|jgi:hypothetical protein
MIEELKNLIRKCDSSTVISVAGFSLAAIAVIFLLATAKSCYEYGECTDVCERGNKDVECLKQCDER